MMCPQCGRPIDSAFCPARGGPSAVASSATESAEGASAERRLTHALNRGLRLMAQLGSVAIVAGVVAAIDPSPASANWWGQTGAHGYCQTYGIITDDKNLYFYYGNPSPETFNAATYVRNKWINLSPLDSFYDFGSAPLASTDVVIRDDAYTYLCIPSGGRPWWSVNNQVGNIGRTFCYSLSTIPGRCNQQYVYIDEPYMSHSGTSLNEQRSLVCHEVGHAIGLRHRDPIPYEGADGGCMQTEIKYGLQYSEHDWWHFYADWYTQVPSS